MYRESRYVICCLWWDDLLNIDAGGRDLVLPQLNVTGFVDFSWEALPFLIEMGLGEEGRNWEES